MELSARSSEPTVPEAIWSPVMTPEAIAYCPMLPDAKLPETTALLPICPESTAPLLKEKLLTVPEAITPDVTCPDPSVAVLKTPDARW